MYLQAFIFSNAHIDKHFAILNACLQFSPNKDAFNYTSENRRGFFCCRLICNEQVLFDEFESCLNAPHSQGV
jgi:hypothetical protein